MRKNDESSEARRVLVAFTVPSGKTEIVERMHAKKVGPNAYVLDNSPFYAYDVSAGDTIKAEEKSGGLFFEKVVSRGGHSTYRVMLPLGRTHEDFLNHWKPLERSGCTYEGSSRNDRRLYAIDIPPAAKVAAIYEVLEKEAAAGTWDFEEAHFYRNDV